MSQIALGLGGIAGWNVLKRTSAQQKQMIANDPTVSRNSAYFRENIAKVQSAGDLVKDYRLLSVALGAFGLEGEIGSKAFIQKVLESDLSDKQSLVNRLSDKRFLNLAEAFNYNEGADEVQSQGFGDKLVSQFIDRELERRVGQTDESMRLALNAQRELAIFAERDTKDTTLWYEVLGNPPLRRVFEGAFGFSSSSFGKIPVERQMTMMKDRAERMFGSEPFKAFGTEEGMEKLVRTYLARSQLQEGSTAQNAYSAALTLLSR
ncbi:MAG: DUF1217 domain-containing protein [Paracoccus sp. (in: a-proteobacteria)]|uniref:DUF1217 domain-containing protein n=1 Tax=Paracoccus sp. TaxID=267 RepID=UPI0026DEF46D|nr:DUF1217 domain-containing protein [Paracoccus sp. (in: a-proteobacteria)]MDO5612989.1 DUF1217 domain-containing protein [Paracoccus sp. (in: a-proteobacteria)]